MDISISSLSIRWFGAIVGSIFGVYVFYLPATNTEYMLSGVCFSGNETADITPKIKPAMAPKHLILNEDMDIFVSKKTL